MRRILATVALAAALGCSGADMRDGGGDDDVVGDDDDSAGGDDQPGDGGGTDGAPDDHDGILDGDETFDLAWSCSPPGTHEGPCQWRPAFAFAEEMWTWANGHTADLLDGGAPTENVDIPIQFGEECTDLGVLYADGFYGEEYTAGHLVLCVDGQTAFGSVDWSNDDGIATWSVVATATGSHR